MSELKLITIPTMVRRLGVAASETEVYLSEVKLFAD
jgi:hypothetical protein